MATDRTHSADALLQESESRYQAVIENASDMIQSVRPDGTFEFVNNAWRSALGYSDEDLKSMTIFEVIHPEFLEHCQLDFMRAIQGLPVDFLATRFLTKDGRTVPVEGSVTSRKVDGEVVATHGFFRDITERLHAQEMEARAEQLEREERARYLEKMAALGKFSAGLAHELNNPAAAVLRANASLKDILHRRDQAILELAEARLDVDCWHTIQEMLDEAIAGRAGSRLRNPLEVSANETLLERWLENHDVERAWDYAASLAESGITAEQIQTRLAKVPAPTLPAAIRWITESLTLDGSTEIIFESSKRITDLVKAIKGYSHMDRALEHEGDIHAGIEDTLIILGHRLRNVSVERQYDRTIQPIRMFGNSLNQVWTNILDNAIDATGGTGTISIATFQADNCVAVAITDSGNGIAPENLARIFEPFFTTKGQGEGTGLGLDTSWRIVTREHNGRIAVESEPGRTTFTVTLPVSIASNDQS